MTADWLAKTLYDNLQRLAGGRIPIVRAPWEALAEPDRQVFRDALHTTLDQLGDRALLRLHQGEPIFVLRAQDRTSTGAIIKWRLAAIEAGMPAGGPKAAACQAREIEFQAWQGAHPEQVKVPD